MNIIEALKSGKIDRLVSDDRRRWMFWTNEVSLWEPNRWVVLESRRGRGPKTLIITESEEEAVAVLTSSD